MYTYLPISTRDIVQITNQYAGTAFTSYRDMVEVEMTPGRAEMLSLWQTSLSSDTPYFDVYNHPKYNYEAIHCFEKSKQCTAGMIYYFHGISPGNVDADGRVVDTRPLERKKSPARVPHVEGGFPYPAQPWARPISEMSVLDIYNGNGLTTVHMARNGFNVESFNDCPEQVRYMQEAAKFYGLPNVVNHIKIPTTQYDIVVSLEVLEHYTDPLIHVADLLKLVKPGGFLVESSGFNGAADNIGHFEDYVIEGHGKVSFREARRITTRAIQTHFTKVFDGFNRMPKIWKRNEIV
jgi:2-polyprenyl-3-methyl-5-hydroxy-6-metoxy-1,4-benzoquinol methylase